MCIWQIVKLYGAGIHACLLFTTVDNPSRQSSGFKAHSPLVKNVLSNKDFSFLDIFTKAVKGTSLKGLCNFFLFYCEYLYIEFLQVDALFLHCGWKFEVANYIKAQYTFYNPVTIKIDILIFCKFNQVEWILS